MEYYKDKLEILPPILRSAFSAIAVQRVIKIYEYEAEDYSELPEETLNKLWQLLEQSHTLSEEELNVQAQTLADNMEPILSKLAGDLILADGYVCIAVKRACSAVFSDTYKTALSAISHSLSAIEGFVEPTEDVTVSEAKKEETEWLKKAIDLLQSWGNKPISRDMFAVIPPEKPEWFAALEYDE